MSAGLTVTIMQGGNSSEREVSLASGAAVAKALRECGCRVHQVDPCYDEWSIPEGTDCVFLALHGTYGEDGIVQARLRELGLAYTGSDPESSSMAFDKVLSKKRFIECGVPTLPFSVIESVDAPIPPDMGLPLVIKPARQGSSVGVHLVDSEYEWREALADTLRYDSVALIEPKIVGREMTVAVMDGRALPVVEIRPKTGSYDYTNKYTKGATDYLCPAPIDDDMTERLQSIGLKANNVLGCRDYSRVDLMLGNDGQAWVLEVNTLPGMTETSLLPKAAAAAGMDYCGLCMKMVELAVSRNRVRSGVAG
ncbi:MAG: D-alanine--D-alanine ligase [Verrucomicrobia bacterium]|nr:D-alanine--D-alanine ligase [Verrucomicrobiota bacterium]MCF7708299.1 D-alanine--D-alanine ligase [Verrucomicrobiota bacterium]